MAKGFVNQYASLAQAKTACLDGVNKEAETKRLQFITPGSGQALTYDAKYADALAYQKDQKHPAKWLKASAKSRGISIEEAMQSIIEARESWERIGIAIEEAREAATARINKATTAQEAHAIVAEFRAVMTAL